MSQLPQILQPKGLPFSANLCVLCPKNECETFFVRILHGFGKLTFQFSKA